MIDLELLGLGADGETLVFSDANGERYSTPITDELRSSLRRDRPKPEVVQADKRPSLKPSHIQSLLRAGLTSQEIATEHDMDLEFVQGFETPITAEKTYIIDRAKNYRIGGVPDGPRLGDLVVDRLAARGVSPQSLEWRARRDSHEPWEITLVFVQGAMEYTAVWAFNPASNSVSAVDEEARWLTETSQNTPLHAIFSPVHHLDEPSEAVRQHEALVDQLNAARGRRVEIDLALDDDGEEDVDQIMADLSAETVEEPPQTSTTIPSISARIYSLAQARTKKDPEEEDDSSDSPALTGAIVTDEDALPGFEDMAVDDKPAKTEKKRTKRRSVPSWDEIVFGSKP